MKTMRRSLGILTLTALASLATRAEAATLTFKDPPKFFNDPAAWDLGYMPGPGDTALFTNAPGGNYLVYFTNIFHEVDRIEVKTFSSNGYARFNANPQLGASLLVTNRIDIYTEGTTTNDSARMLWEYFNQLDVTNGAGTALVEVGNRAQLQVVVGLPTGMGTARVDRLVSTNVESQFRISSGELQTRHGVDIRQGAHLQVGDAFPARWRIQGGTNTVTLASGFQLYLGSAAAASNSLLEISGAGTVYTNPVGNTYIGLNGQDNRMAIRDGARVYLTDTSGFLRVGNTARARLEITGSNTYVQMANGFELASGGNGTNSYCEVSGGAVVIATAVSIGDYALGVWGPESTTLVTGAGTWLTGSNMNIQVGQTTLAKGTRLIVSSGAVVVARNLLVSWAAGASNNHAQVQDGGVLRVNGLQTRTAAWGTISNVGGVYQFRIATPGIQPAGGPISIENGVVSFFEVNNAPLLPTGTGLTNLTWMGDNTYELVRATNAAVGAYTFDAIANTGNPTNYRALALDDGVARVTNLTIGADGRLMGNGFIHSETVAMNGLMTPGTSVGALTFVSNLTIGSSADVEMEIGGPAAADYDRIVVLGDVAVDGTLYAFLIDAYEPNPGDTFTLIDNQGDNPVTGTFTGMTNGHVFAAGAGYFRIRYDGGDGNDVTLEFESDSDADTDGDGIPDWWESLHYGGPTNATPSALASNGVNTVLEAWIADLNPTNAGSVFPPITLSNAPYGQLWIVLDPTSTARVYEVSATTNLSGTPASWPAYGSAQTGSGAAVLFVVTNDAPHRSYRAAVRLP
ncbi:MAG TPA: hypothetical protein PKE12_15250 [Kiritimatiellia bacterium]|nr:hypothetical protein [Kiritimatiellia bacterium]